MNIAGFSISRPVTISMLVLAVFAVGLIGLSQLALDMYPDMDVPIVSVITAYTGAPPEEIEQFVTKPLEEALATVENYKTISSTSQEGISVVVVRFEWGQDMQWAAYDVREKVDAAIGSLPDAAERPLIYRINPSVLVPVVVIDVTGMDDMRRLREIADDIIKPELEKISGVAAADLYGGLEREIRVEIDWQRLAAYGLNISAIESVLKAENLNVPAGFVTEGTREFTIRTIGEFDIVDQINDIVVDVEDGRPIYLRDVATVSDTHKEVRSYARLNGKPSVGLSVRKESGANTVEVSEAVHRALEKVPEKLPPGIELNVTSDTAEFTREAVVNLEHVAVEGAVLAVIIIFLFLATMRGTVVVAISIPFSILATTVFMYMSGMTLNMVTMGGLVLAIGRMIDDSVVVLENIVRHIEAGEPVMESAVSGTRELSMAIGAATFTAMCVFIPLLLIGGFVGVIFSDMALIVVIGLFASLVAALTIVPMLCSRVLSSEMGHEAGSAEGPVAGTSVWARAYAAVTWVFMIPVRLWNRAFDAVEHVYERMVRWALRHRAFTLSLAVGVFIFSLSLGGLIGQSFFPDMDSGELTIEMEAPLGSSIDRTNDLASKVEAITSQLPELEHLGVSVGQAGGGLGALRGSGVRTATLNVKLVDNSERERTVADIQDWLREQFIALPDVVTRFSTGHGPSSGSAIEVTLRGDDLEMLGSLGDELMRRMEDITGTTDIDPDWDPGSPEYQILVDRKKAGRLGLTAYSIAHAIQVQVYGTTELTKFREHGEEYDITVRGAMGDRDYIDDIRQVKIPGPEGAMIPLTNIATLEATTGPTKITRDERQRCLTISCDISGRALTEVVADIKDAVEAMNLPEGYGYEFGGDEENRRESFGGMMIAFMLGLLLIFIILASQFESLVHPWIVMLAIPFELVGVFAALLISGVYFSLMVFLGVLMLTGVVVSNSILLVQMVVLLRTRGEHHFDSIVHGGVRRLRPILMTTIATILAMIPMAFSIGSGNEMWQPLGVAVIGGLTTSTMLTLIVVPCALSVVDSIIAFIYRVFGKKTED